jgi:hypothetical protein
VKTGFDEAASTHSEECFTLKGVKTGFDEAASTHSEECFTLKGVKTGFDEAASTHSEECVKRLGVHTNSTPKCTLHKVCTLGGRLSVETHYTQVDRRNGREAEGVGMLNQSATR